MIVELATEYIPNILFTFGFVLAFVYALVGAMITGAVSDEHRLHTCFMCLFSLGVIASLVGLGLAWSQDLGFASWFLVAVTAFITITSVCARKAKETWNSSIEAQRIGEKSSSSVA